jgi:tetratricopeptide (TPR) repeat protein
LGEEHRSVAVSYNSTGNVYRAKGDFERALEYYHKSLRIGIKILGEQDPAVSAFYFNIGVAYYDKGDYERSLEYFLKSLSIDLQTLGEEHPSIATSYNNIGNIYHDKNDYEKALEYHRKALDLRIGILGEQHIDVAESYFSIARVYAFQGDPEKALEYHRKALSIEQQAMGEEHYLVAESYFHIGNVYFDKGSFDEALDYYNKALTLQYQTLGEQHPGVAVTHQQIGKVYQKRNEIRQALAHYQKTLMILAPGFSDEDIRVNPALENYTDSRYLFSSLALKAAALEKLSRQKAYDLASPADREKIELIKLSLVTCKLASQLTDEISRGYRGEGAKLLLSRETAEIYKNGIRVALRLYNISGDSRYQEDFFQLMEQSKSGVLQEALQESQARQFAGIPDSLSEKERELRIDLAHYRTQIQKETEKKEAERNQEKYRDWQDRLFSLNREYERLIERFENEFPQYYNLKYRTKTISIDDLQKTLDERSAMLSYFIGDSALYIAAITRETFDPVAVPIDSTFGETVYGFYKSLKTLDKEDYLRKQKTPGHYSR